MKHFFLKAGVAVQLFLVGAHLYYNRNGLPIPDVDKESNELLRLMHTYEIEYSFGTKHTLFQTIWGYDLTWASFVLFTILISVLAFKYATRSPGVSKFIAGANTVLWLLCTVAALVFWSPPQQMIFGTLSTLFFLSFIFDWKSPKPKQTRVCVVGGGISGLTAAYYLNKKGYQNVTVLEKANYLGGKCKTLVDDDRPFDLGGHEMLAGYSDIISMAKEVNAPSRRSIPPVVYDRKQKKYLDFTQSAIASGTYSKLQVMMAAMKYLWLVGVTFRNFAKPSTGYKNMPKELTMNLNDWLVYRKLEPIKDILVFVIKVQGYGQFETTAACYLVKFQGFWNWLSLLLGGIGIYKKWPRVFTYGMENLCDRLAASIIDVRKNISINKIDRNTNRKEGSIAIYLEGKSDPLYFDKLIVSTPLDGKSLEFLDLEKPEKELFDQINSYKFYTTFTEVEGLDAGVVASNPMNDIEAGEYTGYIKDFSGEPYCIFFTLALNDNVNGQVVKEKISEVLKKVIPYKGVQPRVLKFLSQNEWHYFPHIPGTDVDSVYNAMEALQGKKNTYFASSALTFECVGNAVAYSKRLVEENF